MRHLLLLFLLITLLTSIDGGNIRKLRNALNAASDHELELLEMSMDMDMNGDMDMDMDTDLDEEWNLKNLPQDIPNANNQGGGPNSNVPQSTPNPGIIESIKQKGSSLWKKGKGLFGKKEEKNGGTNAPGNGKEGDKQSLIKKWKLKLKKGGANTKAKFCRKFQKRPAHCPPCPSRKKKEKSNNSGSNGDVTSTPTQMTPSTPQVAFLESEMEMEMDIDTSGFPNLLNKFCGPPTCDCPKRQKNGFLEKLKLRKKNKNKPTESNTSQGTSTPVNNAPPPPAPAPGQP